MHRHRRIVESLIIGVAQHEGHIVNALAIHVVDSIATATSYTNDLDYTMLLFRKSKVNNWNIIVCHIFIFLFFFCKYLTHFLKPLQTLVERTVLFSLLSQAACFLLLALTLLAFLLLFLASSLLFLAS